MANNNLHLTQHYKIPREELLTTEQIFARVYYALEEKGYDPVNQIVGYIMSGDPTYITSHNNARGVIAKIERDDLIEEAVRYYIDNKLR